MADREGGFPVRLRDLLGGASSKIGVERPVETGRIWTRWSEIVGESIAEHAELLSLRGGTLRIKATSSAWATELGYLVEKIKDAVNEDAGRPLVTEVVISTGRSDSRNATSKSNKRTADPVPKTGPSEPPPADAAEALERAHEAWSRRHSGASSKASEKPKKPW
jgi:hypothetical protein